MSAPSKIIQKISPGVKSCVHNVKKVAKVHPCGLLEAIVKIVTDSKKWKTIDEYMFKLNYVPDMETQINIMSYVEKDRAKKYIKRLIENGHLFEVVMCSICDEDVYVPGMVKSADHSKGVHGYCIRCHCKKYNKRPRSICGEQKEHFSCILKRNIESTHPQYNRVMEYFETLCSNGNINALPSFCANPLAMYECIECEEDLPMFNYGSVFDCLRGFRNECNGCRSSNHMERIIKDMIKNAKRHAKDLNEDPPSEDLIREIWGMHVMADGTYMCRVNGGTFGKPGDPRELQVSFDRILRSKNYSITNADPTCAFLNTPGSGFNFDRKRQSQVEAARYLITTHPDKYAELSQKGEYAGMYKFLLRMYWGCVSRAEKRREANRGDTSGECTITPQDILDLFFEQCMRCAVSGIPLYLLKNHPWSASVDRIDNKKGYVPGNIRLVISMFNTGHNFVLSDAMFNTYLSRTTMQNKIERAAEFGYELDENGMPTLSAVDVLMERPVEYVDEVAATKRKPNQEEDDVDEYGAPVSTSKKRKVGGR